MVIVIIIVIIKTNMCTRADIPFQTLCICKVSMYFIQTSQTKTTIPEVPVGYWEEVAKLADNPGKTFTLEEIQALDASGADAELLR